MRTFIRAFVLGTIALISVPTVFAQEGTRYMESPYDVSTTMDRLQAALESKGMSIFDRIDHSANAEGAGLTLRPTEVLIFGNPKLGTPLMNCAQSVALDLPQKMLAWEDESGQTYLGWNEPAYLKDRHDIVGCDGILEKVSGALANFATIATKK